jgi:hypothetical protein
VCFEGRYSEHSPAGVKTETTAPLFRHLLLLLRWCAGDAVSDAGPSDTEHPIRRRYPALAGTSCPLDPNTKSVTLSRSAAQPRWRGRGRGTCGLRRTMKEKSRRWRTVNTVPSSFLHQDRTCSFSDRVWRHPIRHTSVGRFCERGSRCPAAATPNLSQTVETSPKSVVDNSDRHQIRHTSARHQICHTKPQICRRLPQIRHGWTPNPSRFAPNPSTSGFPPTPNPS